MNKVVIGIIALVVIGLGVLGIMALTNDDDQPTTTNTQSTDGASDDQDSMNMESATNPNTTNDGGQTAQTSSVVIKDFAFAPASITVKKGTKVTWTNEDTAKHDITPDEESDAFKASELLAKGESYEFTFNTVGTYSYHCSPHPNMKATVEVTD